MSMAATSTPARAVPVAPRILLLTYISPRQQWGSAQRTRFLIDALKRHGRVEVFVVNFGPDALPPGQELQTFDLDGTPVHELHVKNRGLAGRPRFDIRSDYVTDCVKRHIDLSAWDLIVCRYIRPALKLRLPANVPVLVDFDDVSYEPPWKSLTTLKMWVGVMLRLFNDRCIVRGTLKLPSRQHAHYFFCNEAERQVFPQLDSSLLPNLPAAPARQGPPDFTPPVRPALMFIGLLDYMPNQDAVDWFVRDIWPRVRAAVPDARFLVVGKGSPETLARWSGVAGVEALGFVDSLADTYAQVTASVVPMRSGGGTNIKALEAYLYGRPVVGTHHVRNGHGTLFRDGPDMLVADDAQTFAQHCIDLLKRPERAETVARNGHDRIASTLTRDHFDAVVDRAVRQVLQPPTRPGSALRDTPVVQPE
jgi:glycosyltransferase involved in cell wall biosynthesis